MEFNYAISILELAEDCSIEDVERAYKRLALRRHPDKGGTEEDMASLNDARSFLIDQLSAKNLPAVIKQFELAVRDMNIIARDQRANEKKVEKVEHDILQLATNRFKSWKQTALLFAAISAAALFLGKDLPKELVSGFGPSESEIVKPTTVDRPEVTDTIKKYNIAASTSNKDVTNPVSLKGFTEKEKSEIAAFDKNKEKYQNYLIALDKYNYSIKKAKSYPFMWFASTISVGIYAGLIAWFFNQKIQKVEAELSELSDSLSIKSQYVKVIREIFGGPLKGQWTLKEIEYAILDHRFDSRSLNQIVRAIGAKKFAQLLIAKGQAASFLAVTQGNLDNGYEESYAIS